MPPQRDDGLDALAERQHGLVTRSQLLELGFTRSAARHQIEKGRLRRAAYGILRVAGAPITDRQRVLAAVLEFGPSAVASHATAAAVWGLPGFDLDPIHVTAVRGAARRRVAYMGIRHEPRLVRADHISELDQIPVTTPARTLFDLAGQRRIHPKKVERTLDTALVRRLTSIPALQLLLGQLAARGRPGIRLMRQLLDDRAREYVPTESGLEFRFAELLQRSGMPAFRRQVHLGDAAWVGRVDFVHPRLPLVVEVDSALHHGSLTDRRHDRARHVRLEAEGWQVVSASEVDVFHRSTELMARIRTAIATLANGRAA